MHVDDDPLIQEITKLMLLDLNSGFEIDRACCVDEGFKKLAAGTYDVVVSDFDMPQKDGLQFLKELREAKNKIPFILFTGKGREEVAIKALNLGADGYYNKQGNPKTVYGELTHGITLVTEKAKAKLALEASEKRYHTLMDNAVEAIFIHDIKGKLLDVNLQACKNLQYTREELLSKSIKDISVTAEDENHIAEIWSKVLAGNTVTLQSTQIRKDKSRFPIEVTLSTIFLDKEKLVIALVRDITERKKTEVLKESGETIRNIFSSLPDLVFFKDTKLKYVATNGALEQYLGLKPSEAIGKSDFELLPKEDAQCCSEADMKTLQLGFVSEEETVGDRVYSTIRQRVTDQSGNIIGVVGSIHDITERVKAQEKLKNLKAFDERIISSLGEALLIIDPDNYKIITVNEEALKQMKMKKDDVIGKTCYEMTHHRTTYCQPPNDICPIHEVLETGNPVTVEHIHLDENNNRRIVEVWARPVRNPEGKTVIIHVAKDITERKKMEENLKESRDKLEMMNEKLRVVGGLSRHDVRNKLSGVTGYAYLLKKKHGDQADIVEGLTKMEQAVAESVKIFDFAKMYEQIGVEELTYCDVEAKLKEACALFSGSLPKIINECSGLTVFADSFLRQLFFNFIDNTRKYGKKTTTIRVRYEKAEDNLKLVYEDDGEGVSLENKPHLFKEGFSTGGSTGFGLFLTKRMIDVYGWNIEENGIPDEGAKFTITIPKINKNGKENYQIAKSK